MDIMGSALANPTVPWAYSNRRLMASNKRDLKVECESVSETDRPSANKKRRSYQSRGKSFSIEILDTPIFFSLIV